MHSEHHQYVNIHGIDATMETHGLFRFTPMEEWKPVHKWQHWYTLVLYSLAAVQWAFIKDFKWFFVEKHVGNKKDIKHPFKEYVILMIGKTVHFGLHLFLPMAILSVSWYWVLLGYFLLLWLPGLYFALIFQVTHVFEGTHYPMPDEDGNIENNYAIHVLETTSDFSRKSKFGCWLMGGLNNHAIHHIMPGVCHVHYIPLTEIMIKVAKEHGLEYMETKTFWEALVRHVQMLHHLSSADAYVPQYKAERQKAPVLN